MDDNTELKLRGPGQWLFEKAQNYEAPILAQISCRHQRGQWLDRRL